MSEPRRLVYVIDKLGRAGAQIHLHQLASRLDRGHFTPEVCCLLRGGSLADSLGTLGVPVEELGVGRIYVPRGWAALFRLARRLPRDRAQIVHTYLVSANLFGSLAGHLAGVPAVITSRRWRSKRGSRWSSWPTNASSAAKRARARARQWKRCLRRAA